MTEQITEMSPRLKARIAGLLYLIAGEAYSFAEFSVRGKLKPAGALGELSLILWLIVMGVNSQRWKDQASAAGFVTN